MNSLSLYERMSLIGSIKLVLDQNKISDDKLLCIAYLLSVIDTDTYMQKSSLSKHDMSIENRDI